MDSTFNYNIYSIRRFILPDNNLPTVNKRRKRVDQICQQMLRHPLRPNALFVRPNMPFKTQPMDRHAIEIIERNKSPKSLLLSLRTLRPILLLLPILLRPTMS